METQQTSEDCPSCIHEGAVPPFVRLSKEEAQMRRIGRKLAAARSRRDKLAKDINVLNRYGIMKVIQERDELARQVGNLMLAVKEANKNMQLLMAQNRMQDVLETLCTKLGGNVQVVEVHRDGSTLNNIVFGENKDD